jgi:hypothetical protein
MAEKSAQTVSLIYVAAIGLTTMNYDDDLPIGCVFLAALLFMALFLWLNPV